jgi:fluoroquinolone resistance protein
MSSDYYTDLTFTPERLDESLKKGEYDNCEFQNLDLNGLDLRNFKFTDCTFHTCNLSMVKLSGTAFRNCTFDSCKMLGIRFEDCNPIGLEMHFEGCNLSDSSFYQLKLNGIRFIRCELQRVDFTEANLKNSNFQESDLQDAIFYQCNLEQSDFRLTKNITLDIRMNLLKNAQFSRSNIDGLLLPVGIKIRD